MSDATFQTFLTSGLWVLTAAMGYLAWTAWRWMDRLRDTEKVALAGIGHELEANLKRMMKELAGVADGSVHSDVQLVPVVHSQLDSFLARPTEVDRKSLTMMRDNYNALGAHKNSMREAFRQGSDISIPANVAVDAVISSIATLYLWTVHKGQMPDQAPSTRSWHVRDWMKANQFRSDLLPGLHLRDAVVERLRELGMTLTPRPLSHTASEFYAMQYDRKADPNAPFWKRKPKPAPEPEPELEPVVEAAPEPEAEPEKVEAAPETLSEPAPEAPEAEAIATDAPTAEPETIDPEPELGPDQKPPSSGSVH
ncbi:MAG: hypothetical protein AAGL11_10670 [Pseudomonadota bacterium]